MPLTQSFFNAPTDGISPSKSVQRTQKKLKGIAGMLAMDHQSSTTRSSAQSNQRQKTQNRLVDSYNQIAVREIERQDETAKNDVIMGKQTQAVRDYRKQALCTETA